MSSPYTKLGNSRAALINVLSPKGDGERLTEKGQGRRDVSPEDFLGAGRSKPLSDSIDRSQKRIGGAIIH